jgi:hypothetical protein
MGDEHPGLDPDEESRGNGIWRNLNGRTQIVVAVIGVVGTVLAAVLTGTFAGSGGGTEADPPPATPATGSGKQSTATASPACSKHLRIVTPPQKYRIADGNVGVDVRVDACDLNGDTGWIFDFDPAGDQTYYLGGSFPFAPIAPSDGRWHVVDQGLGSPGDVNSPHIIYLVDASPLCDRALHAAKPDAEGNVIYKTLPAGCSVADSVDVTVVAYPSESAED